MIVFENPGEIDLAVLRNFGVSVKENENPIGFFGTGLKYALAILLRTGHTIELQAGLARYSIVAELETVRGKEFSFAKLVGKFDRENLGFTTDVGRNWSVRDAYRELWANARDEGGEVSDWNTCALPIINTTRIIVTGEGIEDAHVNRESFILMSTPILKLPGIEVHAGESAAYFYRGFRVSDTPTGKKTLYTYNFIQEVELTEDRTAKHGFMLPYHLSRAVMQADGADFIENVLSAEKGFVEAGLEYPTGGASDAFLKAVSDLAAQRSNVNPTALVSYWSTMRSRRDDSIPAAISSLERAKLDAAIAFAEKLDIPLSKATIIVTDNLGAGKVSIAENNNIYILTSIIADSSPGADTRLAVQLICCWLDLNYEGRESAIEFLVSLLVVVAKAVP